ncbi:hypothetical protein EC973_008683 [Apophysomyces ossiformis]|uniref:Uncharacterized protein n=1 Tax=Apophysomyces ossiformis TaxID=679940 RepID=A0A8H7ELH3_9FUNG|nr:hypothetical protein EC973_008683 [Apophysomyces ossiformis]
MVVKHRDNQRVPGVWNNSTTVAYADGVGRARDKEIILMESSSAFDEEDVDHSLGDSWKLIDMMTSTLNTELRSKQDTKFVTAQGLATFGIQLIKDRMTLLKTTLHQCGHKWQIVELRSATIPTQWKERLHLLKVFELLVCLYQELKEQKALESVLIRQQNQVIPVMPQESLRTVFLRTQYLPHVL